MFVVSCQSSKGLKPIITKSPEVLKSKEEPNGFLGIHWKSRQDVFSKYNCELDVQTSMKLSGLEVYVCKQEATYENLTGSETRYMYYNDQYFLGSLALATDTDIDAVTKMLFDKFGAPSNTTQTTEVFTKRVIDTRKEWKSGTTTIFLDYSPQRVKLTMSYYPLTWLVDKMIQKSKKSSSFHDRFGDDEEDE
jgi:hypothetical protein